MTVRLPLVTAEFRLPDMHRPDLHRPDLHGRDVAHAARAVTGMVPRPSAQVAYYAGLGAAAVVGVLEWPVAVAVGAGTVVARRALREHGRPNGRARTSGPDRPAGREPSEGQERSEGQASESPGARTGPGQRSADSGA